MDELSKYFIEAGFTPEDSRTIAIRFQRKELGKGSYFVREGSVSHYLGFLESGLLQYFSIDTNGEERTTYISLSGSFVASLLSFLHQLPARENIRAIQKSTIWVISKSDLQSLQQDVVGFKDFYIGLLEWQICCIDKGKFDLIALTAEQRYQKMLHEEPELLKQVPLQYVASLLAISPRHLTRLRSKL